MSYGIRMPTPSIRTHDCSHVYFVHRRDYYKDILSVGSFQMNGPTEGSLGIHWCQSRRFLLACLLPLLLSSIITIVPNPRNHSEAAKIARGIIPCGLDQVDPVCERYV